MFKRYDPKECVCTINDSIALTGFGTSMITGAKDNPLVSIVEGAQGDSVANVSASRVGTITITLQATSPSNAILTSLAKSREEFKLWVANKRIGERMGGNYAIVENFPSVDYGETVGDRVYTVKVADFDVENTNE